MSAAPGPSQRCRAFQCDRVLRIDPDTQPRRAALVDRPSARHPDYAGFQQGLDTVEVSDR